MSSFESRKWQRTLLSAASALLVLWVATLAFAAGRIEWASKNIKPRSDGNSWNIDLKIYMPRPPDVPTLPMRFSFDQKVYYERAMVDGDKLITRDVPMVGKQPLVESVDVGFLDPGTGKIESRTRYTFKIHRDHGFDCGEYVVTVKDSRTNATIGQPTRIILGGQNEVIDRRSIVFSGEKKKEKPKEGASGSEAGSESKSADGADSQDKKEEADPKKEDSSSELEEPPADETGAADDTAAADEPQGEIKTKPGGCSCRVVGSPETESPWLLAFSALGTGLYLARRRRRPV